MCQIKIHELEVKLQEEEHQRKLIQDKAKQVVRMCISFFFFYDAPLCCGFCMWWFPLPIPQLQTGLEANRILLQSVSPCLSTRQTKEKKVNLKVNTFPSLAGEKF